MPEFAALVSDQAVNEGPALVQCQFNATGFACVQKQANTFYRAMVARKGGGTWNSPACNTREEAGRDVKKRISLTSVSAPVNRIESNRLVHRSMPWLLAA